MLKILRQTIIVKKNRFIAACVLWGFTTFLFGVFSVSADKIFFASMAIGLFASWQLDAPKSQEGDDLIGLFVIVGSVLLSFFFAGFIHALLNGCSIITFLKDVLMYVMILLFIVGCGIGMLFIVRRHANAPKATEKAWKRKLKCAQILQSCAIDAFIAAGFSLIASLVILMAADCFEWSAWEPYQDEGQWLLMLFVIDSMGGCCLIFPEVWMKRMIAVNLDGAIKRGETVSEEEWRFVQWDAERARIAQEAQFGMTAAKMTSSACDDLAVATDVLSRLPDWKSDKGPFILRHLVLFLNILAVATAFYF